MPKKRHWARYSKPQTTVPHSLESSGLQSNIYQDEPQERSVNNLLASLRRASLSPNAASSAAAGGSSAGNGADSGLATVALASLPMVGPTVPPEIAQILLPGQLVPAPAPGVALDHPHHQNHQNHPNAGLGAGRGAGGAGAGAGRGGGGAAGGAAVVGAGRRRRPPPGPAPPPSWLSQSIHAPRGSAQTEKWNGSQNRTPAELKVFDMPGIQMPDRGSYVDILLRKLVLNWDIQRHYNQYYLPYLHGPLRAALISYLNIWHAEGVSIADLRALLLPHEPPPPNEDDDGSDVGDENSSEEVVPSPSTLNEDVRYLDLTGSIGHSVSFKELGDLLFDPGHNKGKDEKGKMLQESWDTAVDIYTPRPLLPSLTHLSLALTSSRSMGSVSWRQLLSFSTRLPTLTHLSLAFWPEPTLTPNAKFATVVSQQGRRLQYGGTGPYSHSLDNDWSEAILVVRKLSKSLYGLEYLDLTGCATWFPALMKRADHDEVDWVGDWGKVTTLVLSFGAPGSTDDVPWPGQQPQTEGGARPGDVARLVNAASEAKLVEKHIRDQRQGRGRFITVIGNSP